MAGGTLGEQVAAELRQSIYSGRYAPGAKLPSETELMERYATSRNTVRTALGKLTNEGLIETTPRLGTFVRTTRPRRFYPQEEFMERPPAPPKDAFFTKLEAEGRQPSQSIGIEITRPPEDVAARLELSDTASTVVRRKVRYLDGEPYEISDAYFPFELVEGTEIMHPGDITRGAGRILAERGHRQERFLDEITSRMPSPEETARLDLGPGTPVTVHVRTGFDGAGHPVRVLMTVLPSGKHIIVYDMQRPTPPPAV